MSDAWCVLQILRMPLFQLPQLISQLVNAQVAIIRLREFLAAAEQHSMPETAPASTGISHAKFEKLAIQYDKFLAAAEQHSMPETAPAGTGISHAQFAKSYDLHCLTL